MYRNFVTVIVDLDSEEWRTVYIDESAIAAEPVKGYGNFYGRYYGRAL